MSLYKSIIKATPKLKRLSGTDDYWCFISDTEWMKISSKSWGNTLYIITDNSKVYSKEVLSKDQIAVVHKLSRLEVEKRCLNERLAGLQSEYDLYKRFLE